MEGRHRFARNAKIKKARISEAGSWFVSLSPGKPRKIRRWMRPKNKKVMSSVKKYRFPVRFGRGPVPIGAGAGKKGVMPARKPVGAILYPNARSLERKEG